MINYYRHLMDTEHTTRDALRKHRNHAFIRQTRQTRAKIYPSLSLYRVLRAWFIARAKLRKDNHAEAHATFSQMLSPHWRID